MTLEITGVTTNHWTASCNSCTKKQLKRERRGKKKPKDPDCECVAPAEVNDPPTTACVLPAVNPKFKKNGRIYRFEFAAESEGTGEWDTQSACEEKMLDGVAAGGLPAGRLGSG